jgi:hypothetical protein
MDFCGHGNSQCTSDLISQIGGSTNFDLTNESKALAEIHILCNGQSQKRAPRIICVISGIFREAALRRQL